jgi:hypothetical protein
MQPGMQKVQKRWWVAILLLCAFSVELLGSNGRSGMMLASAAEAESQGQPTLRGRDVLVAGANAVADGKSPALATIDFGEAPVSPRSSLQILLSPVATSPDESYLILVSIRSSDGEKRLGSGTFFPPRTGAVQPLYFNVAPVLAEMKAQRTSRINLSIALVPPDRSQTLSGSAVRLVGARLLVE